MKALSGRVSNEGIAATGLLASDEFIAVIGVWLALRCCDISCSLVKEGLNVLISALGVPEFGFALPNSVCI